MKNTFFRLLCFLQPTRKNGLHCFQWTSMMLRSAWTDICVHVMLGTNGSWSEFPRMRDQWRRVLIMTWNHYLGVGGEIALLPGAWITVNWSKYLRRWKFTIGVFVSFPLITRSCSSLKLSEVDWAVLRPEVVRVPAWNKQNDRKAFEPNHERYLTTSNGNNSTGNPIRPTAR